MKNIEEAFPPFAAAYAVTARNNEISFMFEDNILDPGKRSPLAHYITRDLTSHQWL